MTYCPYFGYADIAALNNLIRLYMPQYAFYNYCADDTDFTNETVQCCHISQCVVESYYILIDSLTVFMGKQMR